MVDVAFSYPCGKTLSVEQLRFVALHLDFLCLPMEDEALSSPRDSCGLFLGSLLPAASFIFAAPSTGLIHQHGEAWLLQLELLRAEHRHWLFKTCQVTQLQAFPSVQHRTRQDHRTHQPSKGLVLSSQAVCVWNYEQTRLLQVLQTKI